MTEHQERQRTDNFSAKVATYFDDLAPSWSKNYTPQGSMRNRIERFSTALADIRTNKGRVLDFGCGAGTISAALARLDYQMTGCDISPQMIETARQGHPDLDVRWMALNSSQKRLPFNDGEFDAVIASSVLEYVPDPGTLLAEFHRIVAPGGVFVCTVPDERHPVRQAEQAWLNLAERPLRKLVMRLLPPFMPQKRRYDYLRLSVCRWPVAQWQDAFSRAGFTQPKVSDCIDPLMLLSASPLDTGSHV